MDNLAGGLILVAIGGGLVLFRRAFAELVISFQITAFRMPFGKREVDGSEVIAVLVGLCFIAIGLSTILGIAKWR